MTLVENALAYLGTLKGLLVARVSFFAVPEVVSYAAGLTAVSFTPFFLIQTGVALAPTAILVWFGSGALAFVDARGLAVLGALGVGAMLAGGAWFFFHIRSRASGAVEIVPAILPKSFDDLRAEAARVAGLVPRVQIDIADGSFAPSVTWPYTEPASFARVASKKEAMPLPDGMRFEVDMLIQNPERVAERWLDAGASELIVHIGTTAAYERILGRARGRGAKVGYALLPSASPDELARVIEAHGAPDFLQVMGSDTVGFHGVPLDPRAYELLRALRARFPALPLAVDIGVSRETAPQLVEAGATVLVSGGAIFNAPDIAKEIQWFRSLG